MNNLILTIVLILSTGAVLFLAHAYKTAIDDPRRPRPPQFHRNSQAEPLAQPPTIATQAATYRIQITGRPTLTLHLYRPFQTFHLNGIVRSVVLQ